MEKLFYPFAIQLISSLRSVVHGLTNFRYDFIIGDRFLEIGSADPVEASRIYWFETLERVHMVSATSLIRSARWIDAIVSADDQANFLAFSAAFRGFLEATADSYFSLDRVPRTISKHAKPIYGAIQKRPGPFLIAPELEDLLIHFTHGRRVKKSDDVPASHGAKQMREYLDHFDEGDAGVAHDCYSELCETTHPAASSVFYMLLHVDKTTSFLRNDTDRPAIDSFCKKYKDLTHVVVQNALVPPLINLRLVNLFCIEELFTKVVASLDLREMGGFREFESSISDAVSSAA